MPSMRPEEDKGPSSMNLTLIMLTDPSAITADQAVPYASETVLNVSS